MKHLFLVAGMVIALAATACGGEDVVQRFRAEGAAMAPTIPDGTMVEARDYGDATPKHGEIIVFLAPTSPDRMFIKRIIGLPGDTVEISQTTGQVTVNKTPLTESYISGTTSCSQLCVWGVPQENTLESRNICGSSACYFVLGDNRQNSSDSRQGWLVPAENIIGWIDAE